MLRGSERVTRYRVGLLRSRRRVNHDSSRFFVPASPATRTPTPEDLLTGLCLPVWNAEICRR
jgi:hypothetical protein